MAEGKEKPLMLEHQRAVRAGWHRKDLQMNYNTNSTNRARKALIILACAVILAGIVFRIAYGATLEAMDGKMVKVWILCKPGSQVNVRRGPSKNAMTVGYLEVGDSFMTDGTGENGYIHCYGIGENGDGWVYCGFVATEEPEAVYERYVCVAKTRVACRRWMDGPKTENPWLKNGSNVQVFHIAGEWACTNRGYIKSEWLEADPE